MSRDIQEIKSSIIDALVTLRKNQFLSEVEEALSAGIDPIKIMGAMREGMAIVGERFSRQEYFLVELIACAEFFNGAMKKFIEPSISKLNNIELLGSLVLGTPKGDIHDLGKNLFCLIASVSSLRVIDLGVDVPAERFVDKLKETDSRILGMSGLITPVFSSMKETVSLLKKEGLRDHVKVLIGGSVTTPEAREYVGADFQTTDAVEGVKFCIEFLRGKDT